MKKNVETFELSEVGVCHCCKWNDSIELHDNCKPCLKQYSETRKASMWEYKKPDIPFDDVARAFNCRVGATEPTNKETTLESLSEPSTGFWDKLIKDSTDETKPSVGDKAVLKTFGIDLDEEETPPVEILDYTVEPLSTMGEAAAICYNSNGNRTNIAVECYRSGHHRVLEYADVTLKLTGWSAKVIRELYTATVGVTKMQASTRYIDYKDFAYIVPEKIQKDENSLAIYNYTMLQIGEAIDNLQKLGIPKEDASMLLPLAYETTVVLKINVRALIHLAEIRLCTRAYHEFQDLIREIRYALHNIQAEPQWSIIAKWLQPKCVRAGYCVEKQCCGMYPTKEVALAKDHGC